MFVLSPFLSFLFSFFLSSPYHPSLPLFFFPFSFFLILPPFSLSPFRFSFPSIFLFPPLFFPFFGTFFSHLLPPSYSPSNSSKILSLYQARAIHLYFLQSVPLP